MSEPNPPGEPWTKIAAALAIMVTVVVLFMTTSVGLCTAIVGGLGGPNAEVDAETQKYFVWYPLAGFVVIGVSIYFLLRKPK
jgi:hypothetical protein